MTSKGFAFLVVWAVLLVCGLAGCKQTDKNIEQQVATFFRDTPTIIIDGRTNYVLEGDFLLEQAEFEEYVIYWTNLARDFANQSTNLNESQYSALMDDTFARIQIIDWTQSGHVIKWPKGTVLSYSVISNTFPDPESYHLVCTNFYRATLDWESTCGMPFQYLPEFDCTPHPQTASTNTPPLFTVRYEKQLGTVDAKAFYPLQTNRVLLIGPKYFGTNYPYDRVGLFRHEIGHILGFMHEQQHSKSPAACKSPLSLIFRKGTTPYDSKSVMHYLCGGVGTRELKITEWDEFAAQKHYGLPLR